MKSNTFKIVLLIVVAGLLASSLIVMRNAQPEKSPAQSIEQTSLQTTTDNRYVSYQGVSGVTALELLRKRAEVTTESSTFGEFVSTINGVVADGTSEYWAFYVNGTYATEGAGSYVTTDSDVIEWKLEAIQ